MKKAIALLLVSLLAVTAVFAVGNTITVKSIVGEVTIAEANTNAGNNGKALYELFVMDGQALASTTTSNTDVSLGNVEATFKIKQNALVRTNENIDLTVSVGQLTYDRNSTDSVAISATAAGTQNVTVSFTTDNAVLTIRLQYKGRSVDVDADTTIASFTSTWSQKESLKAHPGIYVANITLAYIIE